MFEKLKLRLHERIQKGTIESNLNGERVLMKRTGFPRDWYRVYPPVILQEDGTLKWNVINFIFGGKNNLIRLIMILVVMALFFLYLYNIFSGLQDIINLPCVKSCLG